MNRVRQGMTPASGNRHEPTQPRGRAALKRRVKHTKTGTGLQPRGACQPLSRGTLLTEWDSTTPSP